MRTRDVTPSFFFFLSFFLPSFLSFFLSINVVTGSLSSLEVIVISFIIFTVYRRRGIYRVENFCDIKKTRIYLQAWNDLNPVPLLPAFLKTFFRGWFLISDRDKVSAGCACLFVNIRGRIHKKRERTEAMQTVRIFKKKLYKKREFKKRVCSRQQYARKEVIIYQVCVNKSLEIKRGRRGRRGRRRKKKENNQEK